MLPLTTRQLFLGVVAMVVINMCFLFSLLYDSNINVHDLVSKRISVVILTKDGQRNTASLKSNFPQARVATGNNITSSDIKLDTFELMYKEKYIQELEYFVDNGQTMLVMLLEDDVIPVYTNKTLWYHLAINTIPLFSNDLANFDCSKRGFLLSTSFSDNKSLCRIFSKETLVSQVRCLRSIPDPIDIAIGYCQEQLGITQKRFLAFVHSGMPSIIGHVNAGIV
ncbi:hypothetical protein HPULCUR_000586 [Helicostylum pulchrum]|uniref:Uncharacterized protein n=1 Tax=Helicostylum pulchrum TaxID=562976 RepID=A0ABP9XKC1_9FUNG